MENDLVMQQADFFSGQEKIRLVCGVDEAGRGPIAGPVFAAAVILDPLDPVEGLRDSKKLPEKKRGSLAVKIREKALAYAIAQCTHEEIDELNILNATMLAMKRAVKMLSITPELVLIDGNRAPMLPVPTKAIVRGDDRVDVISAASILAKTARDEALYVLHQAYPQYAFDRHKGYPTALHLKRLAQYGVSPVHRISYAPVRKVLQKDV